MTDFTPWTNPIFGLPPPVVSLSDLDVAERRLAEIEATAVESIDRQLASAATEILSIDGRLGGKIDGKLDALEKRLNGVIAAPESEIFRALTEATVQLELVPHGLPESVGLPVGWGFEPVGPSTMNAEQFNPICTPGGVPGQLPSEIPGIEIPGVGPIPGLAPQEIQPEPIPVPGIITPGFGVPPGTVEIPGFGGGEIPGLVIGVPVPLPTEIGVPFEPIPIPGVAPGGIEIQPTPVPFVPGGEIEFPGVGVPPGEIPGGKIPLPPVVIPGTPGVGVPPTSIPPTPIPIGPVPVGPICPESVLPNGKPPQPKPTRPTGPSGPAVPTLPTVQAEFYVYSVQWYIGGLSGADSSGEYFECRAGKEMHGVYTFDRARDEDVAHCAYPYEYRDYWASFGDRAGEEYFTRCYQPTRHYWICQGPFLTDDECQQALKGYPSGKRPVQNHGNEAVYSRDTAAAHPCPKPQPAPQPTKEEAPT